MFLFVNVEVKCCDCERTFTAKIDLERVTGRIESGGSVELQWPEVQEPADWGYSSGFYYCPDHNPSWQPP